MNGPTPTWPWNEEPDIDDVLFEHDEDMCAT